MDAGENAAVWAGAELVQVGAKYSGQWRGYRYPSPFPDGARFEVPVLAAGAVVGPFDAYLGCGRAESQFAPVVGGFLPFARNVIPYECREGDVVLAEVDGFLRP